MSLTAGKWPSGSVLPPFLQVTQQPLVSARFTNPWWNHCWFPTQATWPWEASQLLGEMGGKFPWNPPNSSGFMGVDREMNHHGPWTLEETQLNTLFWIPT